MAIVCKVCSTTALSNPGICVACCDTLGVVAMPPARRPARPCLRCNGMKFVRVMPREHSAVGADFVRTQAAPMALTHDPRVIPAGLLSRETVAAPDITAGFGVLETYVCLGCEYVEWYCQGAREIPIGPEYMTEVIDYTSDAPYR
ncbi:MAG: hypothetical protein H0T79_09465 [Deltaproteobacteria bacterium]|nr:hypothetical protein [Deltaproteobacteria bacterium]